MIHFKIRCIGVLALAALAARPVLSEDTVTEGTTVRPETEQPAVKAAESAADRPEPTAAPEASWPSEFFRSLRFWGYLQSSYTFNFQKPRPASGNENRGRIFDLHSNEFMLNAFELDVEKPIDEDHPVGFTLTPLVGQTAPVIQSVGLFSNDFDGDGVFESDGNFDLVQAYIQGRIPETGTIVKLGKFVTSAGAEVIHVPGNDNFSRSYLFGFAIPFTHTGLMATQPLLKRDAESADLLSASVGVANGWDNVKDLNEEKVILTNATFTPIDELILAGNFFYSFSEQAGNNENGRTLLDVVATIKPIPDNDDFKVLLNADWGGEEGAAVGGGYASWYGLAGILRLDLNERWYVAGRGEWFNDDGGSRTVAVFDPTGTAGLDDVFLWEMTLTLGYKPIDSLLLRSELRYDKADERVFFHRTGTAAGDPDENHQTTIAFDAVFMF